MNLYKINIKKNIKIIKNRFSAPEELLLINFDSSLIISTILHL